ncbi:WD40-repeat-containing domain protein [Flagelloscypha sp. PMI_526]|nr:WD40-repeat-containing domain protein [Flagelloscypha sp. PMI_526]
MADSHHLELLQTLEGHTDTAWTIAWNPERPLLASCSADKSIRIYSYTYPHSPSEFSISKIQSKHKKTVRSFDSNVSIWEEEPDEEEGTMKSGDWECAAVVEGHETECKCVAYSRVGDEPKLATCSRDKTVWIWEAPPDNEFECVAVLMEHTQDVKSVSWHPHEEILASASYDDTIKLYIDDPQDDWYCFQTLEGHTSTVWSLSWSPCGRYLASASDDRTIRIWRRLDDHLRWEAVSSIEGNGRSVYSISWGASDSTDSLGRLASAGGDGVLRIWEISQPQEGQVEPKHSLLASVDDAHGVHDINAVVWCPRDGCHAMLATTGDDMNVKVWKIALDS